jgi:hypothetical protein
MPPAAHAPRFVGIQPWFPGVLGRWQWLAEPVPAARMAALRIAAAVALLLDIGVGSLPEFTTLFTADGMAGRAVRAVGEVVREAGRAWLTHPSPRRVGFRGRGFGLLTSDL